MTNNRGKLGIDIGGVIIGREEDPTGQDTSFFGPNYLLTGAVPQAIESIALLQVSGFDCYLVSKCGSAVQQKTRDWLAHHNFYEVTGIVESNVHFCRGRADKASICDGLNITHFVDDRLEVLSYLSNVQHLFLFNPDEKEVSRFAAALNRTSRVSHWSELTSILLGQTSDSDRKQATIR